MEDSSKTTIGTLKDKYENEYTGEIRNGKANGKGTKKYKDGRIFTGLFLNDKREGEGILLRPDGTKYIGNYKNDVQEGWGKNITKEGKELMGFFKDGKIINGKAIMYYNEPNMNQMHFTIKYEGDYKNNKREGKGIMYYSNGDREMGDYSNGNQIGKHVILTRDGNIKEKYY